MATRIISRNFAQLKSIPELYNSVRDRFFELYARTNCHPLMLRLAWHDAGTYDVVSKTGGPNGSIRFAPELSMGANNGLGYAKDQVDLLKKSFPHVSYADLVQISGVSAVEYAKGPRIPFRFGRIDAASEAECTPDGRLPDASKGVPHLKDIFYRMGLNDLDIVALSGGHTLGRAHQDRSGWDGPWTKNELVFDNSYFVELLHKKSQGLLRLPTDDALLTDPVMKKWVEKFASDSSAFFKEYSNSHQKLSELGNH